MLLPFIFAVMVAAAPVASIGQAVHAATTDVTSLDCSNRKSICPRAPIAGPELAANPQRAMIVASNDTCSSREGICGRLT